MENEKLKKLSLNLVSNKDDWMQSFRKNIDMYIKEKDITLREISEKADISFDTLKTFVYGSSTDCKLSTAIKLARAFNVSIDELVGAETIETETRECIRLSRNLKDHHRYVIRSYVRHQYKLHGNVPINSKQISVMLPECKSGYLKTTNVCEALNIDNLDKGTRSRVCLGLKVPCEHYEPYFHKGEIILLGVDRDGTNDEKCVISHGGNFYICIKKINVINSEKKVSYISLLDGHSKIFDYDEIDDKIGYVIGYLIPDEPDNPKTTYSWGER